MPLICRSRNAEFDRIRPCRRIATRDEKSAANALVFVKLAAIRLWLRDYESTTWLFAKTTKAPGSEKNQNFLMTDGG